MPLVLVGVTIPSCCSPYETVVQLERARIGQAGVKVVASVQALERGEAEEVYVDVQTTMSEKDLDKTRTRTKKK